MKKYLCFIAFYITCFSNSLFGQDTLCIQTDTEIGHIDYRVYQFHPMPDSVKIFPNLILDFKDYGCNYQYGNISNEDDSLFLDETLYNDISLFYTWFKILSRSNKEILSEKVSNLHIRYSRNARLKIFGKKYYSTAFSFNYGNYKWIISLKRYKKLMKKCYIKRSDSTGTKIVIFTALK